MTSEGLPVAVRATAELRQTMRGRQTRVVHYDVRFSDGRLAVDVDLDAALHGRDLPADAWATRAAAEAACPDEGTGAWVEYATGRRLDR